MSFKNPNQEKIFSIWTKQRLLRSGFGDNPDKTSYQIGDVLKN